MGVRFDHTIVHGPDGQRSASFVAEILGLPAPRPAGPFAVLTLADGATLDFMDAGEHSVDPQHYAFRVDEPEFDAIFARIRARGLDYWGDPFKRRPGEIYHQEGGRGVYFEDPGGNLLEVLTRP